MFYELGLLIVTRARLVLALGLVALAISAVLGVGCSAACSAAGSTTRRRPQAAPRCSWTRNSAASRT